MFPSPVVVSNQKHFQGRGFVQTKNRRFNSRKDVITFLFKTFYEDGLLYFVGNDGDNMVSDEKYS